MADIFVSYKREDQEQKGRVIPIVRALEAEGFDVFYDVEIPPGSTWEKVLQSKINMAKCVLVLWSEASVASDWVKEEAEIAKGEGKIIPVFLDAVNAPFGFGRIEGANLVDWDGDLNNVEWKNLVRAVKSKVGEGEGRKQPEVTSVPMPVNRTRKAGNGGGAGKFALIGLLLAVLGVGGYFGFQMLNAKNGSAVKPPRPAIAERVAEQMEDALKLARKQNSVEGYEAFLKRFPDSDYAEEIKRRIAALQEDNARKAFLDAEKQNSIEGWEKFLSHYSDTSFGDKAKQRLVELTALLAEGGPSNSGRTLANEDCIAYSGKYNLNVVGSASVRIIDERGGGTPLSAIGYDAEKEMRQALNIIETYKLRKQCFVARPLAPLKYWLTEDHTLPAGNVRGEDCLPVSTDNLRVDVRGGMWLVYNGRSSMLRFETKEDAEQAVSILRHYEPGQVCYVGRPGPSMMYLKK